MTHCFVLFSILNIEVSCQVSFGAKKGIPQQKHLTWAVCFFNDFFFQDQGLKSLVWEWFLHTFKKSHPDS